MSANDIANALLAGGVVGFGPAGADNYVMGGSWGIVAIERQSIGNYYVELEQPVAFDAANKVIEGVPFGTVFQSAANVVVRTSVLGPAATPARFAGGLQVQVYSGAGALSDAVGAASLQVLRTPRG